jgi:hypothetical protein
MPKRQPSVTTVLPLCFPPSSWSTAPIAMSAETRGRLRIGALSGARNVPNPGALAARRPPLTRTSGAASSDTLPVPPEPASASRIFRASSTWNREGTGKPRGAVRSWVPRAPAMQHRTEPIHLGASETGKNWRMRVPASHRREASDPKRSWPVRYSWVVIAVSGILVAGVLGIAVLRPENVR